MPKTTTNPKTAAAQSFKDETYPIGAIAARMTFIGMVSVDLLLLHENGFPNATIAVTRGFRVSTIST